MRLRVKISNFDLAIYPYSVQRSGCEERRAIFLDLDGTLWPDEGPGSILSSKVESETFYALQNARRAGFLIIGFSNQTLFGYRKLISPIMLGVYALRLRRLVSERVVDALFVCHHHPSASLRLLKSDCKNRKPSSGLVLWAASLFGLNLNDSIAIGDRVTDLIATADTGVAQNYLIPNQKCLVFNEKYRNHLGSKSYNFFLTNSVFCAVNGLLQSD